MLQYLTSLMPQERFIDGEDTPQSYFSSTFQPFLLKESPSLSISELNQRVITSIWRPTYPLMTSSTSLKIDQQDTCLKMVFPSC